MDQLHRYRRMASQEELAEGQRQMEAEARRWVAQGIRGEVQPETPQIQDGLVEDSTHTTMMVQPRSGKMSQPQSVRKEAAETPKDRLAIEDEDRTEGRKKAAESS